MLKKINLKMILCGVAVLIGVVAACMIFAPAIASKQAGGDPITGLEVAFGKKAEMIGMGIGASAYMLPFFLAIIGVALAVVAMLGKGGKIVPIVAAVCFVGAAICYFLPLVMVRPDFGELGDKMTSDQKSEAVKEFREMMKKAGDVGAGAIVGGIFSIIAAVVSVVPVFVCKD